MKGTRKRCLLLIFIICFMVVGCQQAETGKEQKNTPQQIQNVAQPDQSRAHEASQMLKEMKEVTDAQSVSYEDKILAVPEIRHWDRLRLEQIRKTAYKKLTDRWPNAKVYLSTDRKAGTEIEELSASIKQGEVTDKDIKSRIQKIEEHMKG